MSEQDKMRAAGAALANVAFNWAQQEGHALTCGDVVMLDRLRREWDDALRAGECVPLPKSEDQAALMALLGEKWLRDNAPHRLRSSATTISEAALRELMKGTYGSGKAEQDYFLAIVRKLGIEVQS